MSERYPTCSGPCDQGRKACPTPSACGLGDDDREPTTPAIGIMIALIWALSSMCVFSLVAIVLRW